MFIVLGEMESGKMQGCYHRRQLSAIPMTCALNASKLHVRILQKKNRNRNYPGELVRNRRSSFDVPNTAECVCVADEFVRSTIRRPSALNGRYGTV